MPFPLFYSDDCSVASLNSTATFISTPLSPTSPPPTVANTAATPSPYDAFFPLIAGVKNPGTADLITSYPGPILGGNSYLLISAGPDNLYFSGDDIVMTDH